MAEAKDARVIFGIGEPKPHLFTYQQPHMQISLYCGIFVL